MGYRVATGKYCAYNQSRERFLGADVDAVDFSTASQSARLPTLLGFSGKGIWLTPFAGIFPTNVSVPVDLVYLDRDYRVIDTVESFPIFSASSTNVSISGVLVLPDGTIRSTRTMPDDQLMICSREEMQQRLGEAGKASTAPEMGQQEFTTRIAFRAGEEPVFGGVRGEPIWDKPLKFKDPMEEFLTPESAKAETFAEDQEKAEVASEPASLDSEPEEASDTSESEREEKSPKRAKNWLERLLQLEPLEPRYARRESLPGLTAHFYTGGAPAANDVRDISTTGLYVFTNERWYPGTVIRMTLTDRREPTAERSLMLYAAVVRIGEDGVGLVFVPRDTKQPRKGPRLPREVMLEDNATSAQIHEFIRRLKRTRLKGSASSA